MILQAINRAFTVLDFPPVGDTAEREYFAEAAAAILAILDPFIALAATSEKLPIKAANLARRLIHSHHQDAKWAHNLVVIIRKNEGDTAFALEEHHAALALDPNFVPARVYLGNALLVSGDAEGARQAYQAVRDVELHIVAAAEGFANLALAAGDRTAALQHYLDAAKWDQVDPRYLTSAARIEMASGKAAKGEKLLRRALRKPWQNPRTWKHRPQKMPPCTLQRLAVCVIWVAMPERWRPTAGFWLSSAPITHVPLLSRCR